MIHAEGAIRLPNTEEAITDPWIRVLTTSKETDTKDDHSAKLEATFKVDVEVEGVKIQALVDTGS